MGKNDVIITLKADVAAARRQLNRVNKQLRDLGGTARDGRSGLMGMSGAMGSLAKAAAMYVAPALALRQGVQFIKSATTEYASFDQELRQSILIAGEATTKYDAVNNSVQSLAGELGRAPRAVLSNWKGLRSILDTTEDAINANRHVTELLMTKQGNAGQVAVTFASIMKDFGIEAESLKVKVDQIISRSAFQNLDDWNETMQEGVSTAKAYGRSVDELLIGTKLFNDALRNAPVAGQTYKMFMNKLGREITPQVKKVLRQLGISAAEVNTEFVDQVTILKRLAAAQMDVSQAQILFGERAGPRVKGMLERIREGVIDLDKEMALTVPNIELYNEKLSWLLENTQTDINQLAVSWKQLKFEAGELASVPLGPWFETITKNIQQWTQWLEKGTPVLNAIRMTSRTAMGVTTMGLSEAIRPGAAERMAPAFSTPEEAAAMRKTGERVRRFEQTHPGMGIRGAEDFDQPIIIYGDFLMERSTDLHVKEPGEI